MNAHERRSFVALLSDALAGIGRALAVLCLLVFEFAPATSAAFDESGPAERRAPRAESGHEAAVAPASEPSPAKVPSPADQMPIDRQPYRVHVRVVFENAPQFDAQFRRSILDGVRDGIERCAGPFWQAEVDEETGTIFSGFAALKRLRPEAMGRAGLADVHKLFLLSVQLSGGSFAVAGREWDTLTSQLGPLIFGDASYDRREIADRCVSLVYDLFRPIAVVELSPSGSLALRARGGDFVAPDAGWRPLTPGSAFEPFLCFLNNERAIERIQRVPWTYLVVDEVERGLAGCTMTSGLRTSLAPRRRVQTVALGINRRTRGTELTLVARSASRRPLAGVEVEIAAAPAPQLDPEGQDERHESEPIQRLVADRQGAVAVSAGLAPDGEPLWLTVRSGQALLARVPFVPGVRSADLLELPDDTLRLETEGSVAFLQAELVDTVARRAVLVSLAKARAKANEWEAAAALLKELDQMPKASRFAAELNAIRLPALKSARARRDRTTEVRIQKLCDETLELVTTYLDEEKIKEVRDDIAEMRQLAEDEAAAQAKAKQAARDSEEKPAAKKKRKKKSATPAPQRIGF